MSPRTREQFEAMREASREKIVETAVSLFARHGYAGTSVRMIAREAGISSGLLYHYFEGKRGVLGAIFDRGMENVAESFARVPEEEVAEERLRRLVAAVFEIVERELPFWRLNYQLRMQPGVVEELGGDLAASAEEIRGRLEALLGDLGADAPAVDARALFAAIDGAAQHFAMDPERYPADAVADALVRCFLPRRE